MRYLYRRGLARRRDLLKSLWWGFRYRAGGLDIDDVVTRVVADMAGDSEQEMKERCERWFESDVLPLVSPRGREVVRHHQDQGHVVALLSGSSPYGALPLGKALEIEHVLCTQLEVADGQFTGRVTPPICYGAGKVHWARDFAARHDVDLERSYFYTDSHTDLPMLLAVGEPRVVNPDRRLAREAAKRGWAIQRFMLG